MASVKEQILEGLKPALTAKIKADIINTGILRGPISLESVTDRIWKRLRTNVQTAGALIAFGIKKSEIDDIVKQVFEELGIEVK